ncbi:MAG: DUF6471 domain-containing protein [Gammaproteobacteria bacterium]|nr:DUF6471 domain-containing protein [Gammaproteobacteria bacterium]
MDKTWTKKATNMIKGELTRRGIGYDELQEKMAVMGIEETANSINVKINRGSFSFVFFLQVMKAIGAKTLRLEEE